MPSFVTVLDNYKQYADLCLSPDSSTCVLLFTDKYVQSARQPIACFKGFVR
jgi:hypothetical protein